MFLIPDLLLMFLIPDLLLIVSKDIQHCSKIVILVSCGPFFKQLVDVVSGFIKLPYFQGGYNNLVLKDQKYTSKHDQDMCLSHMAFDIYLKVRERSRGLPKGPCMMDRFSCLQE